MPQCPPTVAAPRCKVTPFRPLRPTLPPLLKPHTSPTPPDISGEVATWRAVVTQALMDASSNSRKPESRAHKRAAIHWLLSDSEDFIAVCLYGGLDPEYVREKARAAIANGCKWRRSAGEGRAPRVSRARRRAQREARLLSPEIAWRV